MEILCSYIKSWEDNKMNEIQDERYHIADEAIYDAFFLILKEKELDKITVSDVIKKAGIVRSTFYNHYENIPDLVDAIENKTINDIFSLMNTFHPKNDWDICKSYYLTICEYTMTNPFLANLLSNPRKDAFFEKESIPVLTIMSSISSHISISNLLRLLRIIFCKASVCSNDGANHIRLSFSVDGEKKRRKRRVDEI